MSCDCPEPKNCCPTECRPTPDPILPLCDVALPDGSYPNATVTVEDGCIVMVQSGRQPLYAPDPCCAPVGGGGGADGEPGPPGAPGAGATVTVGTVEGIPYGQPPRVENVGTDTNAVLNFYLPRGERGEEGQSAGGGGDTMPLTCGWELEGGLLTQVPFDWPPLTSLAVNITPPASGMLGAFTKDGCTASVNLDISSLLDRITNLENAVTDLQSQIDECCGGGGGDEPGPVQTKDVPAKLCSTGSIDINKFRLMFNPATGVMTFGWAPGAVVPGMYTTRQILFLDSNDELLYSFNAGVNDTEAYGLMMPATLSGFNAIARVAPGECEFHGGG